MNRARVVVRKRKIHVIFMVCFLLNESFVRFICKINIGGSW